MEANHSRRGFLCGALALPAVVAAPAITQAKPDPLERLRRAASEARAAMRELGADSYFVMIREEPSGVAKALSFNSDGTLKQD